MALQRGHVFLGLNAVVWLLGVVYVAMLRSSLIRDEDQARVREDRLTAALADAVLANKQTIATHAQVLEQMRLGCGGTPLVAAAPVAAVCPPCPAFQQPKECAPCPSASVPAAATAPRTAAEIAFTKSGVAFAEDGSFVLGPQCTISLPPENGRSASWGLHSLLFLQAERGLLLLLLQG